MVVAGTCSFPLRRAVSSLRRHIPISRNGQGGFAWCRAGQIRMPFFLACGLSFSIDLVQLAHGAHSISRRSDQQRTYSRRETSVSVVCRGRDEDCSPPPAQIRTCGFPASGSCLRSNVIGLRGIGYPCSSDPWARRVSDTPDPAQCPGRALQLALPSTGHRPSTVSAADVIRLCSRLHRYHAAVRLLVRVHAHRSAVTFMGRSGCGPDTSEVSQVPTKGRLHMHMGSQTARGSSSPSHCGGRMLLSGQRNGVSTSKLDPFRSSITQPVVSPVNASRLASRPSRASLGAGAAG